MNAEPHTVRTAVRCAVCGSVEDTGRLDGLLRFCTVCQFTWTTAALAPPEALDHSGYFEGEGYFIRLVARRTDA